MDSFTTIQMSEDTVTDIVSSNLPYDEDTPERPGIYCVIA
ncbi:hypothetical protein EUX98_g8849 [Antrodiella citrinella]|uniref:Uncharacterized protein n=1 Tax=Antrodiella citrinella TaxID=2447956 RepID=A0A4S4M1Z6_9APHY|nr:hypothetical protein EUX98_g8849 [Antrodiella citrinella]